MPDKKSTQFITTFYTNCDDEDNNLSSAILRFGSYIDEQSKTGWECTGHTITKDEDNDYVIVAVFTNTKDRG